MSIIVGRKVTVSNLLNAEIRYPVFSNNSWATRGTVGEDRTFFVSIGMKF
ncbi:MAG: hypothetical protein R3E08_11265 [Thiotrichaceae bacterium]